jgi:hypothetical protein
MRKPISEYAILKSYKEQLVNAAQAAYGKDMPKPKKQLQAALRKR